MKPGVQPGCRQVSPAGCCWVKRKSLPASGLVPFVAGLPRSSAQYHSAKMMTLVVQILRASSSSVRPLPALPARIASTRRASAPKFTSVTRAVREIASRRIINRWRPTRFHCASVDALRARRCVHTVAIDNGMRRASSRFFFSDTATTERSLTMTICKMTIIRIAPRASQKSRALSVRYLWEGAIGAYHIREFYSAGRGRTIREIVGSPMRKLDGGTGQLDEVEAQDA